MNTGKLWTQRNIISLVDFKKKDSIVEFHENNRDIYA